MNKIFLSVLLVTSFMTGCSMVPSYQKPDIAVPQSWSSGQGTQPASRMAFDWWKSFSSDELNQLMTDGLNNNLDLKASEARISQARSSLMVSRSSLFPTVDASANLSNGRSLRGDKSANDGDVNLNAGLDINYELDLFGANRAGVEASRANLLSSKFQYDALALVVMGDISRTYFNILNAREREAIADQNLKNAEEILRIVQARYDAGSASGLELAQQKTSLASFQASRASIEQEISVYENALGVLLGKPPHTIPVSKYDMAGLVVPDIATAQPSQLLVRRPDIASAEADLIAANADIGAARAAFLPSISLGAGVSAAALPISSPVSVGLSTASSVLAPIFHGGSLLGNLGITEARKAELVENYRKTVLVAFQEVEDALAAEKASALRETAYKTAVEQAKKAYDLSVVQYKAGSVGFQTVIDSQNVYLSAQQNYSSSRNERLSASIDLFKALGGGWEKPDFNK